MKKANQLAEELEREPTAESYYNYIDESFDGGQKNQVEDLFDRLRMYDKEQYINRIKEQGRADILSFLLKRKM